MSNDAAITRNYGASDLTNATAITPEARAKRRFPVRVMTRIVTPEAAQSAGFPPNNRGETMDIRSVPGRWLRQAETNCDGVNLSISHRPPTRVAQVTTAIAVIVT